MTRPISARMRKHFASKTTTIILLAITIHFLQLFSTTKAQQCIGRVRAVLQSCGPNDVCTFGAECTMGVCNRYQFGNKKYCPHGIQDCTQYNASLYGPRYPHLVDPAKISIPESVVCVPQNHLTGENVCVQKKPHYERCENNEECFSGMCIDEGPIFKRRCAAIPIGDTCNPTYFGLCDRGGFCDPDTKKCVQKLKIHSTCGDLYWKYYANGGARAFEFADAGLMCGAGRICDLCPDKNLVGSERCKRETCETYASKVFGQECSSTYVCRNDLFCADDGRCHNYATNFIPFLQSAPVFPCKTSAECPPRFFCNCTDATTGVCARLYNYENSAETLSDLVDCMVPRGNQIATLHRDIYSMLSSLNDLAWGCKYFAFNFLCKAVQHPVDGTQMFALTSEMDKWCQEPSPYPTYVGGVIFFIASMTVAYCTFSAQVLYCIWFGRWEKVFKCVVRFFWPAAYKGIADKEDKDELMNAIPNEMKESLLDAEHNPNNELADAAGRITSGEDEGNKQDDNDQTETETETESRIGDDLASSVLDSAVTSTAIDAENGDGEKKSKHRKHKHRKHKHRHHKSGDEKEGEEGEKKDETDENLDVEGKEKKRKHKHHHHRHKSSSKTPTSPNPDEKREAGDKKEDDDDEYSGMEDAPDD